MKQGWMAAAMVAGMAVLVNAEPPRYRMIPLAPSAGPVYPIADPAAISHAGLVIGATPTAEGPRAFTWSSGSLTHLSPLAGFTASSASAVNVRGDVLGLSIDPGFMNLRATLWTGGEVVDLAARYGAELGAFDLNDAGVIAGVRAGPGGAAVATLFDDSASELPSRPGWSESVALALNESGLVVGWSTSGEPGRYQPAAWDEAGPRNLGIPADLDKASAHGVNEAGWIIGSGWREFQQLGLLWRGEEMIRIGDPADGVTMSYPFSINDQGDILALVETATTSGYYLWKDGGLTDLTSLLEPGTPWSLVSADAINNLGQIVGTAVIDGRQVGVLLDPIPAPGPLVLLGLAAARRRRR